MGPWNRYCVRKRLMGAGWAAAVECCGDWGYGGGCYCCWNGDDDDDDDGVTMMMTILGWAILVVDNYSHHCYCYHNG